MLSTIDPFAGIPGSEAEADSQASAEIRGGSRVLEVAQLLLGELSDLRHLEAPRERRRLALVLVGSALLVLGGLLVFAIARRIGGAWTGLGFPALAVGAGLLVLARSLHPRPWVRFGVGKGLLVRWRRGRFELLVPGGAEGELIGASRTQAIASSPRERAVPMPHDGRAWLRVGELEVQLAWVRPARRLPRVHRGGGPRWGIAAAIGLSALVQGAALGVVLAVPPSTGYLTDEIFVRSQLRSSAQELAPKEPEPSGPYRRGTLRSAPLSSLNLASERNCDGMPPDPELYLGHLRATGPRGGRTLRRAVERKLHTLAGCYRAALRRCAGAGRIGLVLTIARGGDTSAETAGTAFDSEVGVPELEACVLLEVRGWQFSPTASSEPTQVRAPLFFRYAGVDRFHPDPQGK